MNFDVVLASGSFWPREGGAERQMRQVLSNCVRSGMTCAVVTQVVDGSPRRANVDGIFIVRVGSVWLLRRISWLGRLAAGVEQAWQVIRLGPRVAVSLQLGMASVAVALIRKITHFKHVVRLTGGGNADFRSEPWARRSTWVGRLIVSLVCQEDTLLVSPARHLLNDFAEAFPQHQVASRMIPNGVEEIGPERLAEDRVRSGVVWYARSASVRSTEDFMGILDVCPNLPFVAIGRTEQLPDGASVRRLGWVADPIKVMLESRVLLNTSPTEGMPNMALQALATGMFVVGPMNEGLRELAAAFPDRVRLIALDDPHSVAETLCEVHNAPLLGPADVAGSIVVATLWREILIADRS